MVEDWVRVNVIDTTKYPVEQMSREEYQKCANRLHDLLEIDSGKVAGLRTVARWKCSSGGQTVK